MSKPIVQTSRITFFLGVTEWYFIDLWKTKKIDVIKFANFLATLNIKNNKDVSSQDFIGGAIKKCTD